MKLFAGLILAVAIGTGLYLKQGWLLSEVDQTVNGTRTIAQRLEQYGGAADERLRPDFEKAHIAYPPRKIKLLVLKQEKRVELYAIEPVSDSWRYIRTFPILAASGELGPKLREGDEQVPEGIYVLESLNPNSHYHLALHVGYPNTYDRDRAAEDGRTKLGGDIMIHGSNVSIGCVALGDRAAEDLFVLAAKVGINRVSFLFSPYDFRVIKDNPTGKNIPAWTHELYNNIRSYLSALPLPPKSSDPTP